MRHRGSEIGPLVDRTTDTVVITRAALVYLSWTADLLVYTVVLNLFVEYVEGVEIDSFSISIVTAFLLKVMLVVLGGLEHRVHHFFAEKGTTAAKVAGGICVFAILFGSKLLILEIVDAVFGDDVELGHFIEVAALLLSMMAARRLMDWVFDRLNTVDAAVGSEADG